MSQPIDQITLRVAEGRRVRQPDGTPLLEGEDLVLDRTPFVLRRIRSGEMAYIAMWPEMIFFAACQ